MDNNKHKTRDGILMLICCMPIIVAVVTLYTIVYAIVIIMAAVMYITNQLIYPIIRKVRTLPQKNRKY